MRLIDLEILLHDLEHDHPITMKRMTKFMIVLLKDYIKRNYI